MASELVEYQGHTIASDVAVLSGTRYWKATAAILWPDPSGISNVRPLTGIPDRFGSESEAREYVMRAALQWIDTRNEQR